MAMKRRNDGSGSGVERLFAMLQMPETSAEER